MPARSAPVYEHQLQRKPDDLGLEAHASTPSISAKICLSVKWRAVMAPEGHAATQAPQALQSALITWLRLFSASNSIAA